DHPRRRDAPAAGPRPQPAGEPAAAGGSGLRRAASPERRAGPATGRRLTVLPQPLLIALQFLTRLPVRLPGMPEAQQIGRSLLWYPLVGLLLGGLLLALHGLLGATPALLQAAILLAVWAGLSGGLHLDGLADSADAWVGGLGDRERTLAIMKDPRSGPIAVVVLLLVLLLKFAALAVLL